MILGFIRVPSLIQMELRFLPVSMSNYTVGSYLVVYVKVKLLFSLHQVWVCMFMTPEVIQAIALLTILVSPGGMVIESQCTATQTPPWIVLL